MIANDAKFRKPEREPGDGHILPAVSIREPDIYQIWFVAAFEPGVAFVSQPSAKSRGSIEEDVR